MVLLMIGGLGFILSLFLPITSFNNKDISMFFLGFFLIGLGEWKHYKTYSEFKPPNAYTGPAGIITYHKRNPDFVGVVFISTGAILSFIALLQMLSMVRFF